MNEQRLLLYSSEWQALRVGWLKENSLDGGWTTDLGTQRALTEMTIYLQRCSQGSAESYARYWRALNCLNAVRMGYSGLKVTGTDRDVAVISIRNSLQPRYRDFQKVRGKLNLAVMGYASVEDWGVATLNEFRALKKLDQDRIVDNLSRRAMEHGDREELEWYLDLVA